MPDYDALRLTAQRLIQSFGSAMKVTLVQFDAGAFDPGTDTATVTEQAHITDGVLTTRAPYLSQDPSLKFADNLWCYLPAVGLPVQPKPGDALDVPNLGRCSVLDVKTTKPDTVAIVHALQIRRDAP